MTPGLSSMGVGVKIREGRAPASIRRDHIKAGNFLVAANHVSCRWRGYTRS
jgi:hypothetical protein